MGPHLMRFCGYPEKKTGKTKLTKNPLLPVPYKICWNERSHKCPSVFRDDIEVIMAKNLYLLGKGTMVKDYLAAIEMVGPSTNGVVAKKNIYTSFS